MSKSILIFQANFPGISNI